MTEVQVLTGAAAGTIKLTDGTSYDVTPRVIPVASVEHGGELIHWIEKMHEANGGLPVGDTRDPSWKHVCTAQCGPAAAPPVAS